MSESEARCAVCDGDLLFEVPSDECPELICARCGAAEVVAPIVVHLWLDKSRPSKLPIPVQQRRAA